MNEIREVLWFFEPSHPGAYEPGGFNQALMQAMARADSGNLAKLALVFPTLAYWFDMAKNINGGLDHLKSVIEAEDADREEHQST